MADPLSVTASVGGLLMLAGKIVSDGLNFVNKVRDCPKEIPMLLQEVSLLNTVLTQLMTLANDSGIPAGAPGGSTLQQYLTPSLVAECNSLLNDVKKAIEKCQQIQGRRGDNVRKSLLWPFKDREVKASIEHLRRLKDHFAAAVAVDTSYALTRIEKRTIDMVGGQLETKLAFENEVKKKRKLEALFDGERRAKLLQNISPLDPAKRHQDVRSSRLENTCTWLLKLDQFLKWHKSSDQGVSNRMLWCYGGPGAGKTVMSSLVIDYLTSESSGDLQTCIAFLYCDYRDQGAQNLTNILGSLLRQFLMALNQVPKSLEEGLSKIEGKRTGVEKDDLLKLLQLTTQEYSQTFICLDALDELAQETRSTLLQLLAKELDTTRIFLTGRDSIQGEISKWFGIQRPDAIEIAANPDDIRAYLHSQITNDPNPEAMNDKLREEVLNELIANSHGMFLLPALHIAMVLEQATIYKRRRALDMLPQNINATFAQTMERIRKSRNHELANQVLMWVHLAYRPLKMEELCHALAVEPGHTKFEDENIPPRRALLACCLGLVIADEETSTIRMVHYSLQEYFKENSSRYFPNGAGLIAEICLTYLNFTEMKNLCASREEFMQRRKECAFIDYAARYWGHYARQQCDGVVRALSFNLLRNFPNSATQLFTYFISNCDGRCGIWTCCTAFHAAAYFGLETVVSDLFAQWWTIVEVESSCTPPVHAHRKLHGPTTNFDFVFGSRSDGGITPLSFAASEGHDDVVRLLLSHEVIEVNVQDDRGQTPLSLAAYGGHEGVVQLLLNRDDIDVNLKDNNGFIPLGFAAGNGHEGVTRLLLNREDINVNIQENDGWTTLLLAIDEMNEDVVRLLLSRKDMDVNLQDNDGWAPLSFAASERNEGAVRLLLNRDDIDVNSQGNDGATPLSIAAREGHEGLVQLLLNRDDIDVNLQANDGWAPLSLAVWYEYESVVRLLLSHKDMNVNLQDNDGWAPLSLAAFEDNEGALRLLLNRDDIDVNLQDNDGWAPLSLAASNGHENVVRLLLDREDIDVNLQGNNGSTPLSLAASEGHEGIVRLLLSRKDIDVNLQDSDGRTPLTLAAKNTYEGIVRIILDHKSMEKGLVEEQ